MNPLAADADDSSNANLPKQSPTDFDLSDIPHFTTSSKSPTNPTLSTEPSSWSPSTDEGPVKYEYEFSNHDNYNGYFVCLWDTNDVSACERIVHRPLSAADITYSPSGNGFVQDGDIRYTFTKSPYQRSAILPNLKAGAAREKRRSADDILASL